MPVNLDFKIRKQSKYETKAGLQFKPVALNTHESRLSELHKANSQGPIPPSERVTAEWELQRPSRAV